MRAAAGRDPQPGDVGLAEQEVRVGRECLRAVEELLHLGALHRRDAPDGVLEQLFHTLPLFGQQPCLEVVRDAVDRPGRRGALVATHHEAPDLGSEVDEIVGVAERRQRFERRVERLGDQILVAVRDDRQVDAGEPRNLPGVHAGGVDDDLTLDPALVGLNCDDTTFVRLDPEHFRAQLDLSSSLRAASASEKVSWLGSR